MEGKLVSQVCEKGMHEFRDLGVSKTLQGILKRKFGISKPTGIQKEMIPLALKDHDLIASAYTGSGKTLAYLLPLFQKLYDDHENAPNNMESRRFRGVIIAPTRQLCVQISNVSAQLGAIPSSKAPNRGQNPLRFGLILGDATIESQLTMLASERPDILIATPGRLMQLIAELEQGKNNLLGALQYLIMDEADQLVESRDLIAPIKEILKRAKASKAVRSRWLISATMPTDLKALISNAEMSGMRADARTITLESGVPDKLWMGFLPVKSENKLPAFVSFMASLSSKNKEGFFDRISAGDEAVQEKGRSSKRARKAIVFVKSKHHVEFLTKLLRAVKVANVYGIYGDMVAASMYENMTKFVESKYDAILIATDVAARGADIPNVDLVVNFDAPSNATVFIHRAGRTARGDRKSGACVTFLAPEEWPFLPEFLPYLNRHLRLPGATESLLGSDKSPAAIVSDFLDDSTDFGEMAVLVGELCSRTIILKGGTEDLEQLKKSMDLACLKKHRDTGTYTKNSMQIAKEWETGAEGNPTKPIWFGKAEPFIFGATATKQAGNKAKKQALLDSFAEGIRAPFDINDTSDKFGGRKRDGRGSLTSLSRETQAGMESLRKGMDLASFAWSGSAIDDSLGQAVARLEELKNMPPKKVQKRNNKKKNKK